MILTDDAQPNSSRLKQCDVSIRVSTDFNMNLHQGWVFSRCSDLSAQQWAGLFQGPQAGGGSPPRKIFKGCKHGAFPKKETKSRVWFFSSFKPDATTNKS